MNWRSGFRNCLCLVLETRDLVMVMVEQGLQCIGILVVNFSYFCEIKLVYIDVVICDLVHNLDTIAFDKCYV